VRALHRLSATGKIRRLAFGLVCLTGARLASAQVLFEENAAPQPFRVEFSSSTSCRDATEFTRWLRAFTPRVRPARPGEPALTFVVQLVPTEAGVGGRLTLREPDGRETLREAPSPNCHDVIMAMALIGAFTVDPLATIPPHLMRQNTEPAPPRIEPQPAPESHEPSLWRFEAGERFGAQTALAPNLTWGGAVFASAVYASGQVLSPSVRVAGHFARSTARGSGGHGEFTWVAARVSLCPVRWAPSAALGFRPCVFGDAGQLKAEGFLTLGSAERRLFWSASGLELQFEAELIGPVTIGAEAGVFTPFRRDLFFFGANETVHRIPAVGMTASAGIGLRFF